MARFDEQDAAVRSTIEPEAEYVLVRLAGKATGKDLVAHLRGLLSQIAGVCQERRYTKVLMNLQALEFSLSIMERAAAGEAFVEQWPRSVRLAMVAPAHAILHDHFLENTVVNRGITARGFDNLDEALVWLGVPAEPRP